MIFRIVLENETRYDIYTSCHMIRTTTEPFDGYIVTMNDEEEKFIPERHVKYAFMYRSVSDGTIYTMHEKYFYRLYKPLGQKGD